MNNKIFINSDIILNVLLERGPHFKHSQIIIGLAETNDFKNAGLLVMSPAEYLSSTGLA
jgi:hypothetical protein